MEENCHPRGGYPPPINLYRSLIKFVGLLVTATSNTLINTSFLYKQWGG